jgi:hypothetical protein
MKGTGGWQIVWHGVTRIVLLTKTYAFKIPNFRQWRLGLHGLCANLREREWATKKDPRLCPVVWCMWGGWIVVQRRAEPLTDEQWTGAKASRQEFEGLPLDWKRKNLGFIDGRIVLVDFG